MLLCPLYISIHALLAESDPCRSADGNHPAYFYPRSPCGERLAGCLLRAVLLKISIHALLAESDRRGTIGAERMCVFLSTLSLRRATRWIATNGLVTAYFYPRSPCGERRRPEQRKSAGQAISIHALLAESDTSARITLSLRRATGSLVKHARRQLEFLSTLSLRRATYRRKPGR